MDSGRAGAATKGASAGSLHASLAAGKAGFSPFCMLSLLVPSQVPNGGLS